MLSPNDAMSADERQILADIAATGAHLAHVPEAAAAPGWSYTVGLWHTFAHPEVLVIGLDDESAADLLDTVADAIEQGRRFAAGEQHDGIVHGYPVRFLRVSSAQARSWCPRQGWAHGGDEVPCLQIVYPDQQGRWPWQGDVREGFRRIQPVLERLSAESSG